MGVVAALVAALVTVVSLVVVAGAAAAPGGGERTGRAAWSVVLHPEQTDTLSGEDNRYAYGWVKSVRPSPVRSFWAPEGLLDLADYPDGLVMIERKRFDAGHPGRTTNFHLVGGDETNDGISPLSADYAPNRSDDWPASLRPGLVITSEASLVERRRGHWLLLSEAEIAKDRSVVWTLVWRIRFASAGRGSVHVTLIRNETPYRTVKVDGISTLYRDQKPQLFVWLGGYRPGGVGDPVTVTQSLDQRGRTLEEALADRPRFGSSQHSVSTSGGPDSRVFRSPFRPLDAAVIRAAVR